MRFAICDDEQQHINILTDYFATHKDYHIETEAFESGEALLEAYQIQGSRFDALFIDMEMGGMNGIETANAIRAIDERVIIVFVTSHEEYAIDCFQCSPLRFLGSSRISVGIHPFGSDRYLISLRKNSLFR